LQCNTVRLSKCPLANRDRKLTAEKDLSEAADVAGMQRYFKAICFSKGNCSALLHHQSSVSASCAVFDLSYFIISIEGVSAIASSKSASTTSLLVLLDAHSIPPPSKSSRDCYHQGLLPSRLTL